VNLLSSALPGIRDLRAPLVAGYLWLLLAYLVGDPGRDFEQVHGTAADIVDLAHTIGPIATAAAVSVAAFFLGALSQPLAEGLAAVCRDALARLESEAWVAPGTRGLPRRRRVGTVEEAAVGEERDGLAHAMTLAFGRPPAGDRLNWSRDEIEGLLPWRGSRDRDITFAARGIAILRRPMRGDRDEALDDLTEAAVTSFVAIDRRLVRSAWEQTDVGTRPVRDLVERAEKVYDLLSGELRDDIWGNLVRRTRQVASDAETQLAIPATLLVGDEELAFGQADRDRAEGELRRAAFLPLVVLATYLAVTASAWWAVLVLGALGLLWQGLLHEDASRRMIVETIIQKNMGFTPFDRFREAVEAAERATGHAGVGDRQISAAPSE
jgi:hypothetical protein